MTQFVRSLLAAITIVALVGCGPNLERDEPEFPFEHDVGCLDSWSIVHTGSGFAMREILGEDSFFTTLAGLVGYEIVEPSISGFSLESRLNQECDVAIGMLGWAAAAFLD